MLSSLANLVKSTVRLDRSRRDRINAERRWLRDQEDDRRRQEQRQVRGCPLCGGSGSCPRCGGRVSVTPDGQPDVCAACGGSNQCSSCGGSGRDRS